MAKGGRYPSKSRPRRSDGSSHTTVQTLTWGITAPLSDDEKEHRRTLAKMGRRQAEKAKLRSKLWARFNAAHPGEVKVNERHECVAQVTKGKRWQRYTLPCNVAARFQRDGQWYCGTHDPVAKARREKEQGKKFAERMANTPVAKLAKLRVVVAEVAGMLKEHMNTVDTNNIDPRVAEAYLLLNAQLKEDK